MLSLNSTRPIYDLSGANTIHRTRSAYDILAVPPLRLTRSAYDLSAAPLRLTRSAHAIGASILPKPITSHTKLSDDVTRAKANLKTSRLALAQYSLIENSASSRAAREAYTQAEREVEETCRAWCQAQRK